MNLWFLVVNKHHICFPDTTRSSYREVRENETTKWKHEGFLEFPFWCSELREFPKQQMRKKYLPEYWSCWGFWDFGNWQEVLRKASRFFVLEWSQNQQMHKHHLFLSQYNSKLETQARNWRPGISEFPFSILRTQGISRVTDEEKVACWILILWRIFRYWELTRSTERFDVSDEVLRGSMLVTKYWEVRC